MVAEHRSAAQDPARLIALQHLVHLDKATKQAFDRLAHLAARLLGTPVAVITLVDREQQYLMGCVGLPEPWASRRAIPLGYSFCQYIVESGDALIVDDARTHPLLSTSPAITDLGWIAYLGIPVLTPDEYIAGALAVIDHLPRAWTNEHVTLLQELAGIAMDQIAACSMRGERRAEAGQQDEARRLAAIIVTQHEIITAERDLNGLMSLIVERSQQLTGAGGAVIELADGSDIVYRSASGMAAPFLGLRLRIEGSLSGACIRTGQILRCDDSEQDPRIDRAACRQIGLRSMIVAPLHYQRKIIGALKVLSSEPHAFDDQDSNTLQLMAGLMGAAMSQTAEHEAKQALITERTAALTVLQENAARLRLLIEQIPAVLWTTDTEQRMTSVVGSGLASLNVQPNQIVGKTLLEYFQVDDPDFPPIVAGRRALAGGATSYAMAWHGRTYQVHVEPFCNTAGQIVGTIGIALDVTDRKQAEEALRESEDRFRSLIRDLTIGVLLHGPAAEILLANQAALDMLGLTENQLRGQAPCEPEWNVIYEDGSPFPTPEHPAPQAILTRMPVRNVVMGVYHPARRTRMWLQVSAEPQFAADGSIKQIISTLSDITERKRTEQEREHLIGELQEALGNIKTLRGLLPICASCKKIRDDTGYWNQLEIYIGAHSEANFTHGLCPDCTRRLYPDLYPDE